MSPEAVLRDMLPAVETLLKAVVEQALAPGSRPALYDLEALTQGVLPQVGRVLLQAVAAAQGSGLVGPTRACGCGAEQAYHDQARRVVIQTSVGAIALGQRAYYRCPRCKATSYPLDEQLGLGQAGR